VSIRATARARPGLRAEQDNEALKGACKTILKLIVGALLGAGVFYLFDWASIRLKDSLPSFVADRIAYYRLIAIGLLLILLVLYRPQGILPERRYVPRKE